MKKSIIVKISLLGTAFLLAVSGCSANSPSKTDAPSVSSASSSSISEKNSSSTVISVSSDIESSTDEFGITSPKEVLYKDKIIEYGMSKAEIDEWLGTGDERISKDLSNFMMVYYGEDFAVIYSKLPGSDRYTSGSFRLYNEAVISYKGIKPGDSESAITEKFEKVKTEGNECFVYFENGENVSPTSSKSDIKITYTISEGVISEISIGISEAQIKNIL